MHETRVAGSSNLEEGYKGRLTENVRLIEAAQLAAKQHALLK